jgi:two-component system sensor histidine kinase AlgZ
MKPVSDLPSSVSESDFFLPNFCAVQTILPLILVAQLLVFVLVMSQGSLLHFDWLLLGLMSFYVQWLVLLSAASLCRLSPLLKSITPARAALLSYLLVLLLALLVSLAGEFLFGYFERGRFEFDIYATALWLKVLKHLLITAVLAGIALRYFYLQAQLRWRRQAELSARIDAMQARMRPHFLFNTMNSIASLIAIDAQRAEQAVEDLCALLRVSLQTEEVEIALEEELELCSRYLAIEQLRLGDRLQVEWRLSASLVKGIKIPALALQPLLENAIYHGIQPLPEGGLLQVQGDFEQGEVSFVVTNPMPVLGDSPRKGHGIAVDNTRHRLQSLYGDRADVILQPMEDDDKALFVVKLRYPFTVA